MNRQFVEDRIVEVDPLPFIWNVEGPGPHYTLNVKMSRLKQFAFAFEFGSVDPRQSFPKTEFPERIVKLDISLNELKEIPPEALFPFENLAELDASLNALGTARGIGDLPSLVVLNLSYNMLREMKGLENCPHLCMLQMSHNQMRTLVEIPVLSNLTQLHLSSNKDNPVARDNRYTTAIQESTSVEILDGMFLRHPSRLSALPLHMWPFLQQPVSSSADVVQAKADLKEVARRVFSPRLQEKRDNVGSAVHHFHSRILELQEELTEYEEKLRLEMDGCVSMPPDISKRFHRRIFKSWILLGRLLNLWTSTCSPNSGKSGRVDEGNQPVYPTRS
ncbi:uncharacterized protein LOC133390130 isoform X3 [Rhineura floridana]|uniref:uncharacterized protein LOC133390130 isoform X3 n=1 Tax=Rhineura floridana TaxID=261503 RepID=UPI002AC86FD3|nr:uncharacterized protein LOC133390130 isoform X3 [Rhineura floridana]